jgi:hypothetical protein
MIVMRRKRRNRITVVQLLLKTLQVILLVVGILVFISAISLSDNTFIDIFIGSSIIIISALFTKIKGLEDD